MQFSTELEVLQHSLGVDHYGVSRCGGRDWFAVGPGSYDFSTCMGLVCKGLMVDCGAVSWMAGEHVFRVTYAGRKFVRAFSERPPKRTRSQRRYTRYLESAAEVMSFGSYLKGRHYEERCGV